MGDNIESNASQKAEINFFNSKAAFVAGVVVIETVYRDLFRLILGEIPTMVNVIMAVLTALLFLFALSGKTLDRMLSSDGVDKAGQFLTVMAIVVFILECIFESASKEIFKWSFMNNHLFAIIIFTVIAVLITWGTTFLFFSKRK